MLLDGVRLLRGSDAWTAADEAAMASWMVLYRKFLLGSIAHVRQERCALVGQAVFFDLQILSIMRYLGQCAPCCCERLLLRPSHVGAFLNG
jgi:hypothetical protein